MSLETFWRGWKRAVLGERTETLGGAEYHRIDDGQAVYWTPWKEGRLIPDTDFQERVKAKHKRRGRK